MAKKNYLIEGVSGSGKSSACRELAKHGYKTIDGDKELAYQGDPETGEPTNSSSHYNHIWYIDKVIEIINDKSHSIAFFCGGSRNFNKFIDRFDEVFVLDVDDKTIEQRLATRGDNFGGKKKELELVHNLNKTKEDIPHKAVTVDATKPLNKVVDSILEYVDGNKET